LGVAGGEKLLACNGDKLKSDIVQMAHHGQNGVDRPVYEAIAPKICLLPTPQWLWDNDAGKGYDTHTWKTIVVQGWMREIGADEWYIAKDGEQMIEL
ncbi:MAG: MBL fold metallo-hydrolase, partial [Clostridiales bacterium]|nr:MBL fold metallo-hydrolase [Clostridiales bacterium]